VGIREEGEEGKRGRKGEAIKNFSSNPYSLLPTPSKINVLVKEY
jgi:hypothetical protein